MSRARYCVCDGPCGDDYPDHPYYADVCRDAGCRYCLDESSRRPVGPMPGEVPLFGGDAA